MISGEYGGHAVLCVGYDDTDPNNRYWIMLNSWGAPSNRPSGLFRVSMDMDYDDYMSYGAYDYYAFYWQTLSLEYADPGKTKTLMAVGSTTPGATDWVQYGSNWLYLDVDTSSAGFTETPIYITSLGGTSDHFVTTGATSIYKESPTGFRVYVRLTSGAPITPEYANYRKWHVRWMGIEL